MSVKQRVEELNQRLADELNNKGVESDGTETTTKLINKVKYIATSKEEQEKTVDITKNGRTEIFPDGDKVISKATVNVNVPTSALKISQVENMLILR